MNEIERNQGTCEDDMSIEQQPDFWKRKLLAFLHDPPCKALDFGPVHEDAARRFQTAALPGLDTDALRQTARAVRDTDWWASAADRFCFPRGKAPAKFTGRSGSTFRHPLGGTEFEIEKLPSFGRAEEILQNALGGIRVDEDAPEGEQWRQRFFLYWRRWMEQTVLTRVENDSGRNLAYFPADTRIPDHTIWNHMNVASALEACRVGGGLRPAFLMFQFGPVQSLITAARSTRDLWSGSYLLSWLAAHAVKAVTDRLGPDAVIFPSLRGSGVFDVLHREQVYSRIFYQAGEDDPEAEHSLWERMYLHGSRDDREAMARRLLTPNLPNRFVALIPESPAGVCGRAAEEAVRLALTEVSEACWARFRELARRCGAADTLLADTQQRWQAQVAALPAIAWVEVPWQHDIEAALAEFDKLPLNQGDGDAWTPAKTLRTNLALARKAGLPPDNSAFLWSLNYHRAAFALAARRNTREFDQFFTDENQAGTPKDALTGKEEIVGSEELWDELRKLDDGPFKSNEGPYGAISVVKRLWWREETGFFRDRLGIDGRLLRTVMRLDSVAEVAAANAEGWKKQQDNDAEPQPQNPYVAVIALDGDEMGKWLAGDKTPPLRAQVAASAGPFLDQLGVPDTLPRPLTPSYHMQFSETLANFANHVAERIVRHYGGQLVYAGGDDVLAMVPADRALACARALRAAFRGTAAELPGGESEYRLACIQDGFLLVDEDYPIMVPGPRAEVSCGIAIAHYQHPLQAVVQAAQAAEKRAKGPLDKGGYARAAFAVSLLKRGGETIHWGARWQDAHGARPAIDLLEHYRCLRVAGTLSARFPYALAELLAPYGLAGSRSLESIDTDSLRRILCLELEHVAERQGTWPKDASEKQDFLDRSRAYLDSLDGRQLADFVNLFLTAAFIDRDRRDENRGGAL